MQINPYLLFNGECEAAFKFYAQCLGGKIEFMMLHEESPTPEQVPAGWGKKVLHASLVVDSQVIMGSDAPPQHRQHPQGFSVSLQINDIAQGERIFNALTENGQVQMPFQQTFWAERFGMVIDRFGIPWMINCEKAA